MKTETERKRHRTSDNMLALALLVFAVGWAFVILVLMVWASLAILGFDTSWTDWPSDDWPWFARIWSLFMVASVWIAVIAGVRYLMEEWLG